LAQVLPPQALTVVVNTADDFEWYGLHVAPDLDTVMYTLAGIANPETGWGIAADSAQALGMLGRYGEDLWFRVGDQDLATHLLRTQWLKQGVSLTEVTTRLARSLGVQPTLLPMSDERVATVVESDEGDLPFQEYFVRRAWQPAVRRIRFDGLKSARPTPSVMAALSAADVVILCPSNPYVSIGPILALPGVRDALRQAPRVVAVSPIVGGQALKGPAAKMMVELGQPASAVAIAQGYADFLDGFVMDHADRAERDEVAALGIRPFVTATVMRSRADRLWLAREVLEMIEAL
jgi:LPPG:FO 2-phospho-L-lactate transferase